jgi:hypothetical protein
MVHARDIALKAGLHHVYTGNVHHQAGDTTFCSACHAPLIVRDWYEIKQHRLTSAGRCPECGVAVAGTVCARSGAFRQKANPDCDPPVLKERHVMIARRACFFYCCKISMTSSSSTCGKCP